MAKFRVITSRANMGFFTQVFHTLQHLEKAEREGAIPIVYWTGGIYEHVGGYNDRKTRNIWDFFFEPVSDYSFDKMCPKAEVNQYGDFINIKDKNIEFVSKFRNESLPYEPKDCWNTKLYPPHICLVNPSAEGRLYIHGLINRFLKIRPIVQEKIDSFYECHMKDKKIISLHMRACSDHLPAQGHKIMVRYIKKIKKYLEKEPNGHVFVATDYQGALNEIIKNFGKSVIYKQDTIRSYNQKPVQYGCHNKKKAVPPGAKAFEDALIESVLLSKSDLICRGFSNVASMATFINPYMKSVYVPKYNNADKEYLEIK